MNNKKISKHGFTIVEILVSLAIAGGLALTVAKVANMSQKASVTLETKTEENEIFNRVQSNLWDKSNCEATLKNQPSNGTINEIKDKANRVIIQTGGTYGNGALNIDSIKLSTTGSETKVIVSFLRNKDVSSTKTSSRTITVGTSVNASGIIQSCATTDSTIVTSAVDNACQGVGARIEIISPTEHRCVHEVQAPTCPAGQFLYRTMISGNQQAFECRSIITAGPGGKTMCAANEYLRTINADGTLACEQLKLCGTNEYLRGYNPDGTMKCETISGNPPATPTPSVSPSPSPTGTPTPTVTPAPSPTPWKYFITVSSYQGNLGGQSGANLKCNSDPNRDPTRTYTAVLNTANLVAVSYNNWSNRGGYNLSRVPMAPAGTLLEGVYGNGTSGSGNYNSQVGSSPDFWNSEGRDLYPNGPNHFGVIDNCNNWSSSSSTDRAMGCTIGGSTLGFGNIGNNSFNFTCNQWKKILCITGTPPTPITHTGAGQPSGSLPTGGNGGN